MIDNGEDRVVVVGLGQTNDKVHGYLLEGQCRWIGRDFIHRWASAVSDNFVLLARCTSLNVF